MIIDFSSFVEGKGKGRREVLERLRKLIEDYNMRKELSKDLTGFFLDLEATLPDLWRRDSL
jgi:hypothetical protein